MMPVRFRRNSSRFKFYILIIYHFTFAVVPAIKLESNAGSDRSWVWTAYADVSEENDGPRDDVLAIRFANSESTITPLAASPLLGAYHLSIQTPTSSRRNSRSARPRWLPARRRSKLVPTVVRINTINTLNLALSFVSPYVHPASSSSSLSSSSSSDSSSSAYGSIGSSPCISSLL
jgi:hypothetical protein